jgi:hypothetical protein
MKTLLTFLLTASISVAQTVSPAAKDGSNITSPGQWKANLSFLQAADVSGLYAPLANPTFTGTVSGITKGMVGLGNVDNTSDTNKPISSATQTALDAKQSTLGYTPQRVVNVKDFGAVGDGVADDTQAIQAAALTIGDGTGGVLYFPKGTYLFTGSTSSGTGSIPWSPSYAGTTGSTTSQGGPRPCLQLFSNMAILGDGIDVTILKQSDACAAQPFINLTATRNVRFADLTLDGNRQRLETPYNDSETEIIDTKKDATLLTVERVKFKDGSQEAIDLDPNDVNGYPINAATIFVRDCEFVDIGGEAIHNPSWAVIERCRFTNVGWNRYRDSQDGVQTGAEGQGAIDCSGERLIIRDCEFFNCHRGLHVYSGVSGVGLGQATNRVNFTANPTAGDTVVVNGRTYTFSVVAQAITASASTDVFTSTGAGFANNTAVQIIHKSQGGGGNPVNEWTTYYVRDSSGSTFKLSETNGGAAIDITGDLAANSYIIAVADLPTANQVPIFATRAETVANLGYAINGLDRRTLINPDAYATWATPSGETGAPDVLFLTAIPVGTLGNSLTLSVTGAAISRASATFTGGGTRNESVIRIENSRFEGCNPQSQGAILLNGDAPRDAVIRGNTFLGEAPAVVGLSWGVLDSNTITMTSNRYSTDAVRVDGNSTISNNTFTGGRIGFNGASNVRIIGNDIRSAYGAISTTGVLCDDNTIVGNYLSTVGTKVDGSAATGTVIDFITAGQTRNTIIGNRVVGVSAGVGIKVQSDSIVVGNNVSGATGASIQVQGSGCTVTGNNCANTISVTTAGAANTISGNYASGEPVELRGTGSPESVFAAPVGSTYRRTDGGAGTSHYFKESGTGNTGWIAK